MKPVLPTSFDLGRVAPFATVEGFAILAESDFKPWLASTLNAKKRKLAKIYNRTGCM
jgi:hypothetical protein